MKKRKHYRRFMELADHIEKLPHKRIWNSSFEYGDAFHMAVFKDKEENCGTIACIGGWANTFALENGFKHKTGSEDDKLGRAWLRLSCRDWIELCFADKYHEESETYCCMGVDFDWVTPQDAAEVVRKVARGYKPSDAWQWLKNKWNSEYHVC